MRERRWHNLINNGKALYCCICGELILNRKDASKEHEPPLSRGGKRDQWKYAHKWCNNLKGALTMEEFKLWYELEAKRNGRMR